MVCFDALSLDCALTAAGRMARVTGADGTVSYRSLIHLRDHLGSVRAVVDGDSGSVIETNDYYPFGKRIAVTEPAAEPVETTSPNRWRFSGKEDQSSLGANIAHLLNLTAVETHRMPLRSHCGHR